MNPVVCHSPLPRPNTSVSACFRTNWHTILSLKHGTCINHDIRFSKHELVLVTLPVSFQIEHSKSHHLGTHSGWLKSFIQIVTTHKWIFIPDALPFPFHQVWYQLTVTHIHFHISRVWLFNYNMNMFMYFTFLICIHCRRYHEVQVNGQ